MKKQNLILAVTFLVLSLSASADTRVDESFIGDYKLISNQEGHCPETAQIKVRESVSYTLWITFKDERGNFINNDKFTNLNEPERTTSDTCMTAGPINPFCVRSSKELTTYNPETLELKSYSGLKTTYSNAKFSYYSLQMKEGMLELSYMKMQKPMLQALFTFTPVDFMATDLTSFTLPVVENAYTCTYGK
jgi:hypothetical protein